MSQRIWPGRPFPLGATWDGNGTNFSLFSEHAERARKCQEAYHEASSATVPPGEEGISTAETTRSAGVRPGQAKAAGMGARPAGSLG